MCISDASKADVGCQRFYIRSYAMQTVIHPILPAHQTPVPETPSHIRLAHPSKAALMRCNIYNLSLYSHHP